MPDHRNGRRDFLAGAAAAAAFAVGVPSRAGAQAGEPVVAAASDLQFALEEVAAAFQSQTGMAIKLNFGSSGNFARQIRQGAPFQMFLSADEEYVRDLARDGFARDDGALYAVGRIALVVPHGSPLRPDGSLDDLRSALDAGLVSRFAIANPEHAPYGKRAEEALKHKGLWERIRPRLVYGENVSQAAQFALSGNAQGGIVAYSLALSPRIAALGPYALISDEWHSPLNQRMALLKSAGPATTQFYRYVGQPAARRIFRRYGFTLPGETD